jgi:hypothetical protein|tara:strand:- start:543 stop:899 length:357 start_codon:yes stop_codon:yes gene_type:complete
MNSPAGRLERILLGILLPLFFLICISLIEDELLVKECSNGYCNNYLISLILIGIIILLCGLLFVLKYTNMLDEWFSKESDEEMRSRLEQEYLELDVSNLNSKWAKMEIKHLENKHGEE